VDKEFFRMVRQSIILTGWAEEYYQQDFRGVV